MDTCARLPVAFSYCDGSWLTDTDGKCYLGVLWGIAVNTLGHDDPGLVAVIAAQAGESCTRLISTGFRSRGNWPTRNIELSSARAGDVLRFLASKGLPMNTMSDQGFGESRPVASNSPKGSETFPVFFWLKKNPGCCGRPDKLARNWQLL